MSVNRIQIEFMFDLIGYLMKYLRRHVEISYEVGEDAEKHVSTRSFPKYSLASSGYDRINIPEGVFDDIKSHLKLNIDYSDLWTDWYNWND